MVSKSDFAVARPLHGLEGFLLCSLLLHAEMESALVAGRVFFFVRSGLREHRAPRAPTLVEGNRTLHQSARVVPGVRPRVLHDRASSFLFVESPQGAHASVGRFDTEPRA